MRTPPTRLALLVVCAACGTAAPDKYPAIDPQYADYSSDGSGQPGEYMNAFVLPDQDGTDVDFRRFLGNVIVIDVGAVWCVPCQEAAATAQDLSDDLAALGPTWLLQVLVQDVSGGPPGTDDAREWADAYGLDLPVLADTRQDTLATWQIADWPTVFIVAPDGEILQRSDGAMDDSDIREAVSQALDAHPETR